MSSFNKTIEQLVNDTDKWLYLFRDVNRLTEEDLKTVFNVDPFIEVLEIARILNLNEEELKEYTREMNEANIRYSEIRTAKEEGIEQGIQ